MEQSEREAIDAAETYLRPPDEPYAGAGEPEIPPCPSCEETDEVRLVFDSVEFVGYQCDRCDGDGETWRP